MTNDAFKPFYTPVNSIHERGILGASIKTYRASKLNLMTLFVFFAQV